MDTYQIQSLMFQWAIRYKADKQFDKICQVITLNVVIIIIIITTILCIHESIWVLRTLVTLSHRKIIKNVFEEKPRAWTLNRIQENVW